jgi:hypothetical protein
MANVIVKRVTVKRLKGLGVLAENGVVGTVNAMY